METKRRSHLWLWPVGILSGLVLGIVIACVAASLILLAGIANFAESITDNTHYAVQPKVVNDQVEFEITYRKSATSLSQFIVQDADGNELWRLSTRGSYTKPQKVVYGVIPEENREQWKQEFPADGTPPADIRGKRVKIEIRCGYSSMFGPGQDSTHAEFDIPN